MRKPKAHKLPHSTNVAIAKWKEKNPDVTLLECAKKFSCSYYQAQQAVLKYRRGELLRSEPARRRASSRRRQAEANQLTGDEIVEREYKTALVQLHESGEGTSVSARVGLLSELVRIRRTVQSIKLTGHIKQLDAEILAQIVRRYEPDADNDRVIEVYREEVSKWQASQ